MATHKFPPELRHFDVVNRSQSWWRPLRLDLSRHFGLRFDTMIDPRNLSRDSMSICQRPGLEHWHLHELRHLAASLMPASGVKLQVVSELLGHASIRVTADVFGHILAPDREAAVDVMNRAPWGHDQEP
jgi:integrase